MLVFLGLFGSFRFQLLAGEIRIRKSSGWNYLGITNALVDKKNHIAEQYPNKNIENTYVLHLSANDLLNLVN